MNARQKVKDLITLALDERTPDKERVSAAFSALKIIDKHDLLSSPLDGVMDSIDNEDVRAAGNIFRGIADLVTSRKDDFKRVGRRFRRR